MSAFARQWIARFAPIEEPQLVRDEGALVYESFDPGAFRGWTKREIPVIVNHDETMPIGFVDSVIQHDGWHVACFRLDRNLPGSEVAADVLRPGMGVSLGADSYFATREENRVLNRLCTLKEISVLGAGMKPRYKGAEIRQSMTFPERTKPEPPKSPLPKSPAAGGSSDRAAVGEVVIDHTPAAVKRARARVFFTQEEINERLARAVETGVRGAVEAEVEHMTRLERAALEGRLPEIRDPYLRPRRAA